LMADENVAVMRHVFEHLDSSDPSVLNEHPGLADLKKNFLALKTAFPDLRLTVEKQLEQGEWVATYILLQGTHTGEIFGIAPTHKTVQFQGLSIARVENGSITQYNSEIGWKDILLQTGVLPVTGPSTNQG